jgi:hypothetical protein
MIHQSAFLIAALLALSILCHLLRVGLTILLPVARMCLPPLAWTIQAHLPVNRIRSNLVPMVIVAALPLAFGLATNVLLRMIRGSPKSSLAIRTAAIVHRVAPDQNAKLAFCPDVTGLSSSRGDHYVHKDGGEDWFFPGFTRPHTRYST